MGCGACTTRKAGNLKRRKLLAPEQAVRARAQLPIPATGTNSSCLPTTRAHLAAACTQQRKQFPPSHLPWTHNSEHCVSTEQPWADSWGKSMQGILVSPLEFRILSSLLVQELTGLSMVSYGPIQFHAATLAAGQWAVEASASLRQRVSPAPQIIPGPIKDTPLLKELCYMTLEFSDCNTYPR